MENTSKKLQTLQSIAFDWVASEVREKKKDIPIQYPRIPVRNIGFHEEVFPAVELLAEAYLSLPAAGSTAVCAGLGKQVGDHSLSTA